MSEARLKAIWSTESRSVEVYPMHYHVALRIVQPPRALEALLTPEEARGLAMILEALVKGAEQDRGGGQEV